MAAERQSPDQLFFSFQQSLAGRYSIDRELGRGGMGIVYLAREVHLDRLVAIKLLPPDKAEPSLRERFLREARLAAKLSHPNIIPIHAVEDAGRFVFYVMAFVDGETLAHRVRARGPLSSSEGARVLREVAWALAHAHGQGLVHRDVKPDNILLESSSGRVLVADFGIAGAAGDSGTDGISGTPEFMSPEQVLGHHVDARSDLYGLGATAFYAFSGRFPFEGHTATEILAKQVTEPAPALLSLGVAIPRKLASLVDRCLSKDPERRPASADALAEQLGIALEQRRELPAALRSFVKRTGRLNGGGTLIVGLLLLPISVGVSAVLGSAAGFTMIGLGAIVAPSVYLVAAARRLMLMGFAHQDLPPAFAAEVEQAREELAVDRNTGPGVVTRWLPRLTKVAAAVFAAALVPAFLPTLFPAVMRQTSLEGRGNWEAMTAITLMFSATATVLLLMGTVATQQQQRDIDTDFWSRIWLGRIGRSAFALAKRVLGDRTRLSAMTHRATELSLGMAAEQLYENLPKDSRLALGGLPPVLRRLQHDAQALRKRHDELQEALASAPATDEYAELRAMRDSIHGKLRDAVGAMETIRLNLLRLHAGSGTVESLTTHIELASEVSDEVERLIAAHQEVERMFQFPRLTAPTPV